MDTGGPPSQSVRARPSGYSVYVIELPDEVAPRKHPDLPSLYVGCTGRFITQRFKSHKAGRRAARVIKKSFDQGLADRLTLRWDLIKEAGNPFAPRDEADARERALANELRQHGHHVEQA